MEKLKHVKPSKEYEQEALEYINEFYEYNSDINGTGGLQRYLDNYDGWLEKLEEDRTRIPNEEKVPAETYFLVRENDNKIVGMINIRLTLNENLKKFGGHIGYSIRPTERKKGYNKVNLGSAKTMQALGGKLIREYYDDTYAHCTVQDYIINVEEAIEKYSSIYEPFIINDDIKDFRK